MANKEDGPARGGMGFGYQAAHSAGLPLRQPRSVAEVNAYTRRRAEVRAEIKRLVNAHPELAKEADQGRRMGFQPEQILESLLRTKAPRA